jgi:ABC-type multidrug transport system ATPase subunit
MYAIFIENLTKKYGNKDVLKEVDLKIEEGDFYALMGLDGSRKTTLASIIASVRSPTSTCSFEKTYDNKDRYLA